MDDKQLTDMLSSVKAPAPSETARKQALNAALAAFDENNAKRAQGEDGDDRLTDKSSTSHVRRFLMEKRSVLSGMGGAVALCALVTVMGTTYWLRETEQAENISFVSKGTRATETVGTVVNDPQYVKKIEAQNKKLAQDAAKNGASQIPMPVGAPEKGAVTFRDMSSNMAASNSGQDLKKITASTLLMDNTNTFDSGGVGNAPAGSIAPQSAAAPQQGQVALPATPPPPAVDALAEWRQKTEAKRVQMENEQVPEEKQGLAAGKDMNDKLAEVDAARKAPAVNRIDRSAAPEEKEVAKSVAPPVAVGSVVAAPSGPAAADTVAQARARIAPAPVARPVPYYYQPPYQAQNAGGDVFPDFEDNSVKEVSGEPVSTFSMDVDTSSYSFIRRMINGGHLPPKGAVRVEELINYFPYSYAAPSKGEDPFRPVISVYNCPWRPSDKLVHIGVKAYEAVEKPKSNIVLLIDTSGSMNAPDRLPLVVASFKLLLASLQPDDTVGIVTYAGYAGVALPPTKVSDKAKIESVLDGLYAEGSTAGYAGLTTAYDLAGQNFVKGGNNRIILATDGDFNVGISDPNQLKDFVSHKRDGGVSLSVLGVGQDNYHDTTMQALAKNGNGTAAYVDNLNEARKILMEEAGSTLYTVAKDAKIQVEFNPATVQEYRLIGYETRHLNREDFNDDRVDAGDVGAGHAVTAIYEITPVGAEPLADGLRYGAAKVATKDEREETADKGKFSNEYGFLKIRYKRPEDQASHLLTRPISAADEKPFGELSDDVRFATAVAGFGQVLRESRYTSTLTWDQIIAMAEDARGKDTSGYRAEFVNLLRLAKAEAGTGSATPPVPAAVDGPVR